MDLDVVTQKLVIREPPWLLEGAHSNGPDPRNTWDLGLVKTFIKTPLFPSNFAQPSDESTCLQLKQNIYRGSLSFLFSKSKKAYFVEKRMETREVVSSNLI